MEEHDRLLKWADFLGNTNEAFRTVPSQKIAADDAIRQAVGSGFTHGYVEVNTPETHAMAAVVRKLGRMRETFKTVSCNQALDAALLLAGRVHGWLASRAASALCTLPRRLCCLQAHAANNLQAGPAKSSCCVREFSAGVSSVIIQTLMMCIMHEHADVTQNEHELCVG